MKTIALTGSIGMGKTTTVAMFKDMGVPIWDADSAVHRLYDVNGAAVGAVSKLFPEVLTPEGSINRDILAKRVLGNVEELTALEAIVHPLVGQDRALFLDQERVKGSKLVILDVPLLFETGGQAYVEGIIVVSCHSDLQRARVLARPGMTEAKFQAILARQMPDAEKRERADFLITTDTGLDDTREQVGKVYSQVMADADLQSDPN